MKLCARCTGLYSGLIFGFLVIILIQNISGGFELTTFQLGLILAIGVGPFAIDGITQLWGWRKSNNYLRLVTGLVCGITLGIILIWILFDIIN
jgi:uncharacterized membrane protein